MVAGLGSLMSSPPLTSKMWSKASMTMAEEGTMSAVAEEEGAKQPPQQTPEAAAAEGTMSAVAEEGTMSAVAEEEGAKQPPQQAPQQTPEAAEEGAMSAVAEEEGVE